jgi:parallel beta-helix repeat protein
MKKLLILAVLALVAGLLAFPGGSAQAAGTDWYVATTGNDGNDCLSPATACLTVQAAIDKASSDDTIHVANGTYTATSLASIVITTDGLSLVGQSRDGTIIDGGTWGTSGAGWPKGIHVYANDVTIQNLTVRGFTGDTVSTGGYGILFRDYAHDTPGEGYIFYSGGLVENVKSENNYSPMYALVHQNLTVRNSLIQNNLADGMFIARECDNATITGNTVLNSGDHGIWVGNCWSGLGPSDNATITDNLVDGAREGGISFVGSDTALISGNSVTHVKGEEPEGTGGWSRGAISLKDGVSNVIVRDNQVYENDGLGTGSGRGIGVDGTSSNVSIVDNNIKDNAGGGIKVMGTATGWQASDNCIYGNTGYGAENTTGATLDFERNWWGRGDGPSGVGPGSGDAVSADVDFDPWLTAKAPACGFPVGGAVDIQVDSAASLAGSAAEGSGSSAPLYAAIAGATAAAVLAIAGGTLYARRRLS